MARCSLLVAGCFWLLLGMKVEFHPPSVADLSAGLVSLLHDIDMSPFIYLVVVMLQVPQSLWKLKRSRNNTFPRSPKLLVAVSLI